MQIIWGRNAVYEALRGHRKVLKVYVAGNLVAADILRKISDEARIHRVTVQKTDRHELDRLAGGTEHQGVVAQVADFAYAEVEDILRRVKSEGQTPFLLILDSLQDPQNFGSLLRTSEAVGVNGVIIPKHRAVGVTASVVKSSAGAVEHLEIAQVTNLVQAIDFLKKEGVWIAGVDASGKQEYDQADFSGPVAIVVGGEGAGVGRLVREHCDFIVSLPMVGMVSSLNAAVAGSVVLYEVLRQRLRQPAG